MNDKRIIFKQQIKAACELLIRERIENSKRAMNEAQASANNEEKSSAGDKYETGRAMGHLNKDMHARQLNAHVRELSALLEINVSVLHTIAGAGSFVKTSTASYFIAAGLGKQLINGEEIICLSLNAPLGQQLSGLSVGDSIQIGNKKDVITEIF